MNEEDLRLFQQIKEKAERDRAIWDQAQENDYGSDLPLEIEEAIMERMFLVYYTEKYLTQQAEIKRLTKEVQSLRQICRLPIPQDIRRDTYQ